MAMMPMLTLLTDPNAWAALLTLTALEIVLGIDNVIFISVLAGRLDPASNRRARQAGLLLALILRIALLFGLTTLARLRYPVVTIAGNEISWHDIILIGGGLFLIAKATFELHHEIEGAAPDRKSFGAHSLLFVIVQIGVIDLVFSIDSVVTAIGMVSRIEVMIVAVLIAILVMYFAFSAAVEAINIVVRQRRAGRSSRLN
jgi:predicted tellurium resistance membrane protein TerC